jgi:hypothetical protein
MGCSLQNLMTTRTGHFDACNTIFTFIEHIWLPHWLLVRCTSQDLSGPLQPEIISAALAA